MVHGKVFFWPLENNFSEIGVSVCVNVFMSPKATCISGVRWAAGHNFYFDITLA